MYYFIINPKSRSGKGFNVWTTVKQELDKNQILYAYFITRYPNHATELTKELCDTKPGIKNIIVVGGDGTVNEVVNGIPVFEEVLLGYIPSGSSNDLGRSLKLSKDPLDNLHRCLTPTRFGYMDIGFINAGSSGYERQFTVSSGIGFDAAICEEALHSKIKNSLNKYALGKLTYLLIALKQIMTCSFLDGEVVVDGSTPVTYKKILMLTTMIHKYEGGGLKIAPKADPRDGKLSICIVHGLSRFKLLLLLPTLLIGKHTQFKGVKTFDCENLEINIKEPAWLHVDGECPAKFKSVRLSCITNKLRFMM